MLVWLALGCRPPDPAPPEGSLPPEASTTTAPEPGAAGPAVDGDALVFRVPARHAERVEAWLYADPDAANAALRVVLTPAGDQHVGSVSLAEVRDAGVTDLWYGLRAWGPNWPHDPDWTPGTDIGRLTDVDGHGNRYDPNKLLIDPWAHELSHDPQDWSPYVDDLVDSGPDTPRGLVLPELPDVAPGPDIPLRDTVVYEVHVRGLTANDPDVPEDLRGTYAGAALKAPYLADLGVTAIELLPVAETFNDHNDDDPDSNADGDNYWGYSTLAFFAPDRRHAHDDSPGGPTREFAAMVEAFHVEGIEVWIDVVYNHTAEGYDASLSWRGLDNAAYYQLDGPSGYRNDNGVGPNVDATDPHTQDLVLDSLRWWSERLGVDGFRFDLAPILGNGCSATCFEWDPDGLLARIDDEVDAKVVAEPWGATAEAYQAGQFPGDWAEWNDGYRDLIRADLNRADTDEVTPGQLADAWSGSWGRFGDDGRQPWHSVNFVTAHDGLTLHDLFRCDAKDNDQPWPYGPSDGGTDHDLASDQDGDPVEQRRATRTALALLLLSAGVPMIGGGDEMGRTQNCNNNAYNVDGPGTWLDWTNADPALHAFTRRLLQLRADHPALRPDTWRPSEDVTWYAPDGTEATAAYLDEPTHHALAVRLDDLVVAYNGWSDGVTFALTPTGTGEPWHIVADSAQWLEDQDNHFAVGTPAPLPDDTYLLDGGALVVLRAP